MSRITSVFVAVLVSCLAWFPPVQARTLTMCYDNWKPYAFIDAHDHITGITIEILQTAAKTLGHDLRPVYSSYDACRRLVRSGNVDIKLFSSGDEDQDLPHLARSTEYWLIAAVVPAESPQTSFSDMRMFAGKTAGLVQGYVYPDSMTQFKDWKSIHTSLESETNMNLLQLGRIDVTFDDYYWLKDEISQRKAPLKVLLPIISAIPQYTIFAKKDQALARQFDAEISKLFQSGKVDAIYKHYTGSTLAHYIKPEHP
ncbi:substrate-binding periplasmic protein [Leeia oryzae]|uniref:substrate-binding periplasmic protein n=1 Tax=Leeia oryzae TaxID=356662 RepID=UPI000362A14F|nr:transporter substrate-binding domain-containing protein [Leeia oryzae]